MFRTQYILVWFLSEPVHIQCPYSLVLHTDLKCLYVVISLLFIPQLYAIRFCWFILPCCFHFASIRRLLFASSVSKRLSRPRGAPCRCSCLMTVISEPFHPYRRHKSTQYNGWKSPLSVKRANMCFTMFWLVTCYVYHSMAPVFNHLL